MAENIAAFVKRHRKAKHLTQDQLAQLAGVSRETIFEIEKGEKEHGYSTITSVIFALDKRLGDLDAENDAETQAERARQLGPLSNNAKRLIEICAELDEGRQKILVGVGELLRIAAVSEAGATPPPEPPQKAPRKK